MNALVTFIVIPLFDTLIASPPSLIPGHMISTCAICLLPIVFLHYSGKEHTDGSKKEIKSPS